MALDIEKIKEFKRLYVASHQLFDKFEAGLAQGIADEQSLDAALEHTNTLINMLPLKFTTPSLEYPHLCVLHINIEDAEAEPEETVEEYDDGKEYDVPENTHTFFEETALVALEDWKFILWNNGTRITDPVVQKKYVARMLAQAYYCMSLFPDKSWWEPWEKTMMVLYANQIGWFAYLEEQDTDKLAAVLKIVEKGYLLVDRPEFRYLLDTYIRLLLKLERPLDAYPIVRDTLEDDPDFADFTDLKTDTQYLAWLNAVEQEEKPL